MTATTSPDNARIQVVIDADLKDLIPGFMKRRHDDVNKLAQAIDQCDFKAVRIIGHSLKGNGGGYGFYELSTIGAAIESAANSKDLTAAQAAVAQYVTYLERVEIRFE